MPVNTAITLRKGSATQWSNTNPVLASGEPGYDLTNNILKIGDGTSPWNSLSNHQHTTSNISGLNSTATELNYLQGVTPGTGIANKALVLDGVGSIQVPLLIQSYGVEASFLYAPDSNILNIASNSGTFSNSLKVNNIPVSVSGHTHSSSDITNFNSSVSGLLPVTNIIGGTNISVVPSGSEYTISVSGQLGLTAEEVDDRINDLLVAGTGITLNYNDSSNTLTIATSGLQPSGNYALSEHASSHAITGSDPITIGLEQVTSFDGEILGGDGTPVNSFLRNLAVGNGWKDAFESAGGTLNVGSESGLFVKTGSQGYLEAVSGISSSDITNFNSSVSGLVSGVYAPLNNPNFSGTLSVSGVPLAEIIDDEVAGLLVAGSGINLNYNDASNTLTVDTNVNTSLVAGSGISLVYNSTTDELSINNSVTISNTGNNRVLTSNGSALGISAQSNLTFDGTNLSAPYLISTNSTGDEGGEIQLAKPATNSTISGVITVDVYQNRLRFFEQNSPNRGYYLDITSGDAGVNAPLNRSRTFSTFTAQNNQPPASSFATLDTRNSILVLDFDDASVESAVFMGIVPEGTTFPSGIQVSIDWAATSATSGDVRWRVEFEKGSTDYDADSFDTATEGNGTAGATAGIPITTNITATSIDSLSAGDLFRIKISRVGNDATNDTMVGDAELIAIELRRV